MASWLICNSGYSEGSLPAFSLGDHLSLSFLCDTCVLKDSVLTSVGLIYVYDERLFDALSLPSKRCRWAICFT